MILDNHLTVCSYFFFWLQSTKCFFKEGLLETSVYLLKDMTNGHCVTGPAIIIEKNRYLCVYI